MMVIYYLNNGLNDSWQEEDGSYNLFLITSFLTSLLAVFTHGISLLKILYDDNIKTFYLTLQFLKRFRKKDEEM